MNEAAPAAAAAAVADSRWSKTLSTAALALASVCELVSALMVMSFEQTVG